MAIEREAIRYYQPPVAIFDPSGSGVDRRKGRRVGEEDREAPHATLDRLHGQVPMPQARHIRIMICDDVRYMI